MVRDAPLRGGRGAAADVSWKDNGAGSSGEACVKSIASVVAVAALVAATSCRSHPGTAETTEDPAGARAGGGSPLPGRSVQAEVVSTNPAAQMITVRPSVSGDQAANVAAGAVETALPVQGEAAGMLGMLRSGDRVVLTCEAVPESAEPGGAPRRGVQPEGQGEVGVDAGALGAPCPAVIRIEKVAESGR